MKLPAIRPPSTDLEPTQLPFWPDELRGLPWPAIRSALFAPVKKGTRTAHTRAEIAAVGEVRIIYTGHQLDQADLDVFQQILHIARTTKLGEVVKFNRREFLRQLQRSTGKSDRDWLLKSLSRLASNEIEIATPKGAYAGSLIVRQGRDEETGTHYIVLDTRLYQLYAAGWTPIRWTERKKLIGHQLAQWLHAFVAGQRHPLTWPEDELYKLSNASYARMRDFRDALEYAAKTLRDSVGHTIVLQWNKKRKTVTLTRDEWIKANRVDDNAS